MMCCVDFLWLVIVLYNREWVNTFWFAFCTSLCTQQFWVFFYPPLMAVCKGCVRCLCVWRLIVRTPLSGRVPPLTRLLFADGGSCHTPAMTKEALRSLRFPLHRNQWAIRSFSYSRVCLCVQRCKVPMYILMHMYDFRRNSTFKRPCLDDK